MKMYDKYMCINGSCNQSNQEWELGMEEVDMADMNDIDKKCMREQMEKHNVNNTNEVDQYLLDRYVSLFSKNFEIDTIAGSVRSNM